MTWDEIAGRIAQQDYSYVDNCCMDKTNQLASLMIKSGLNPGLDFKIMGGTYRQMPHAWIEDKDGNILDATKTLTAKEFYKPIRSMSIFELQRRMAQRKA